ncbi:MAG: SDR family NAD(P)-dependent oxidoreductase [Chloroflexota bacterium]
MSAQDVRTRTPVRSPHEPGSLDGHVAIVTGAGAGIGRAIAKELAAAGATTALVDVNGEAAELALSEIEADGGSGVAFMADVTHAESVTEMVAAVQERLGPPDILVNNVGGTHSVAPLAESDPENWWSDVALNLGSTYLCSRAVLPLMIDRRQGRIVNVASNGAIGGWPLMSAYAAAKAGVVSLTSTLAREVATHGITVFALHPGHIKTKLVRDLDEQLSRYQTVPKTDTQLSSPDAAARLCVHLAAGHADHLSGHFFSDATDSPQRLLWRSIARLGMIRRDVRSLFLTRTLLRNETADAARASDTSRRAGEASFGLLIAMIAGSVSKWLAPWAGVLLMM